MLFRLENNERTKKKLSKLDNIYLIGYWAKYGYMTFKDSGKTTYDKYTRSEIPLVWQYDDRNGTDDAYYLRPIYLTTTGLIVAWYKDEDYVKKVVEYLNERPIDIKYVGARFEKSRNNYEDTD